MSAIWEKFIVQSETTTSLIPIIMIIFITALYPYYPCGYSHSHCEFLCMCVYSHPKIYKVLPVWPLRLHQTPPNILIPNLQLFYLSYFPFLSEFVQQKKNIPFHRFLSQFLLLVLALPHMTIILVVITIFSKNEWHCYQCTALCALLNGFCYFSSNIPLKPYIFINYCFENFGSSVKITWLQ